MTEHAVHERRATPLEVAEAIATTWPRRRSFVETVCAPVREWMLDELAPRQGETILEVAAGVGDTGFEAARAIAPAGRLVSTDVSATMVEAARRRSEELGIANVEFRVTDAEATGLPEASFDAVLCRFGYMLMRDPAAALRETRRVLRPGGRLVLAVWAQPERNPFFTALAMALIAEGALPPPDPGAPGPFLLADREKLDAALHDAGFADTKLEEVPVSFDVADVDEYLDIAADTAGGIGLTVRSLTEPQRSSVRSRLGDAIVRYAGPRGYSLPGVATCAWAS